MTRKRWKCCGIIHARWGPVDSFLPALDLDPLCPDYYKMGFVAAEYLIARGHRRIAFIGGLEDSSITQDKKLGFEDCMRSHGLEVPEGGVLYAGIMIYENGGDVARRILKNGPLTHGHRVLQ